MVEGKIVAVSDDRRRRLAVLQRPDGLYVLHSQRLIDPNVIPAVEYDLVEVPFPANGEPIPDHCYVLEDPFSDTLYGTEDDAAREAEWLIRQF